MLTSRLNMSQRRACRAVQPPRSTQRYQWPAPDGDAALRMWLRGFSATRPRWGYRRAHVEAVRVGYRVNRKKIQRLWREEGLRSRSTGANASGWASQPCPPSGASPSGPQVWAADFQFDTTAGGRLVKILGHRRRAHQRSAGLSRRPARRR